jgi:hypothetical protein
MKICILSGNPKKDGLCQSVIDATKLGAQVFDYIGINRWNKDYKTVAAKAAAYALASRRKNGDDI